MDFTSARRRNFAYGGANGKKVAIWIDGEPWFLKLPPRSTRESAPLSYRNSCITEYIGCHVFELADIPVQETRLGTYRHDGREEVVVACKDFVPYGYTFRDFIAVKNSAIDSSRSGRDTELATIEEAIDTQDLLDADELERRFWDMLVVDALIANNDRHNGNWGIISNGFESMLAPVFDCGGCLFPDADENLMKAVLNDPNQLNAYIFSKPSSAIKLDGRRPSLRDFMWSAQRPGLDEAVWRIVPRVSERDIVRVVEETPCLSDLQRAFYETILVERKERLLDQRLQALSRESGEREADPREW